MTKKPLGLLAVHDSLQENRSNPKKLFMGFSQSSKQAALSNYVTPKHQLKREVASFNCGRFSAQSIHEQK